DGSDSDAPLGFHTTYTWPQPPTWPGRYADLRVLNNFVTELHAVDNVPEDEPQYTFLNPREGWVFIRIAEKSEAKAYLDDEKEPLVWRKHPETGALEAMRLLAEGEHRLRLSDAQGGRLDVRAVPEIAFCYWPTRTVM